MALAPALVAAPVAAPRLTGLLTAAEVREPGEGPWMMGAEFDSPNLGPALWRSDIASTSEKTFGTADTFEYAPFYVYAGAEDNLIGGQDLTDIATRRLAGNEAFAVDQAFLTNVLLAEATVYLATASPIGTVLRELEQVAAANYGALPLIHLTIKQAYAALAADLVDIGLDGRLMTGLGTPVAVGGGYAETDATTIGATNPTGTQSWAFVTGAVTLTRSPIIVSTGHRPVNNIQTAVAERVYVPLVDAGMVYAALSE